MSQFPDATAWQKGEALMQDAENTERSGDKQNAYLKYRRGLQYFIESLRSMPQCGKKQKRQDIVNTYLTHAEGLNRDLSGSPDEKDDPTSGIGNDRPNYAPPNPRHNKPASNRGNRGGRGNAGRGRGGKSMNNRKRPIKVMGKVPLHLQQNRKRNSAEAAKPRNNRDADLYSRIENEIISHDLNVRFDSVVGLEDVKQALLEAVILPAQRPDIFVGARAPPKGLLLFGPPGNGKTFIAKALASECEATFFCVSASSLTSRYVGESEKLVRALFELARENAPSIIFIDEIDSILTSRGGEGEQDSSRRLKTEFLVQMDGVQSGDSKQRVLLVGATNRPWELDEAVLRRFPKKQMVTLPCGDARFAIIQRNLASIKHNLSKREMQKVVQLTQNYSASDLANLVSDAAMGPVRDVGMDILKTKEVPPVTFIHFTDALANVKSSIDGKGLQKLADWDNQFGTKMKVKKQHSSTSAASQSTVDESKKNGLFSFMTG